MSEPLRLPLDRAALDERVGRSPFIRFLGLEVLDADPDAQTVTMRMPMRPELERTAGTGQYHLPRANPPKAISPTRIRTIPSSRLQTSATTIPTITMIPPSETPAIPPPRSRDAIWLLLRLVRLV